MRIKAIWRLTSTPAEVAAIAQILNSCPPSYRYMPDDELAAQRAAADRPIAACANF